MEENTTGQSAPRINSSIEIDTSSVIGDGSLSYCVNYNTSINPGKTDRYGKSLLTNAHLSTPVQPSNDMSSQSSAAYHRSVSNASLMAARVTPRHNLPFSATPSLDRPASTRTSGYLTESRASFGRSVAAKHPHYEDFNTRLTSFVHWSSSYTQNATSLASAGLFYTGTLDLVRCFFCGIGLRHWEQGDDPLEEHVRHSPDCEFLNAKHGRNTITRMKESLTVGIQPQNPSRRYKNGSIAPIQSEPVEENVRSPQHSSYQVRVSTYSKWPRYVRQTPAELAEAGLYFTGVEDIVRCYACDGGLRRWNPEDDPWVEHAKWFPNCSHVKKTKGNVFIERVRALVEENVQHPENPSAQDLNQLSEEMNKLNAGAKEDQGSSKEEDPLSTPAAQSVQAMGYSKKAILMAISELNKETSKPISSVQILELLMDKEENGEKLPEDEPEISSEDLKNVLASDTASSNLIEENQKLISVIKCADCKREDRNCLFLPCTHHRFCEDCAAKYTSCPVCGRAIKQKLKTYMS